MNTFLSILFAGSMAFAAPAEKVIEAEGIKPLGNVKAPVQGTLYIGLRAEPESLNPLTSTDLYASEVQAFITEGLMVRNSETYEWMPGMAEKAEISKDGKTFTFYMRKDLKWHDGKPITAEDVKFSFEALIDPKFDTAHVRPYVENIESATVIDPHTIQFKVKEAYFGNFDAVAGGIITVVPKHIYKDPKKKLNKTILGSGPYIMDEYRKGKSITLKRNPNWWGNNVAHLAGRFKAEKVFFRFVKEENVRLEMLKKGSIDYDDLTSEQYEMKTNGAPWGKTVFKKQVENSSPKGYLYVGWNQKNEFFKDRDVRIALAHLMNRDLMIEKFEYGKALPATGPWYQQSPFANSKVKPLKFDPKKAGEILKKAGWADSDKDGVLDKKINGKQTPFRFTLMYANRDREKYYTIYKEDMKKAGIDMILKVVEWNSLVKALNEKKFEAVALGWSGGGVNNDPKQIWHSASSQPGGSNYISYHNPKVDKLIDEGRKIMDAEKRKPIWAEVYKLIAEDAPYAFMFNDKYVLYAHTAKVKMEKPTYKYDIGTTYWWLTE